MILKILFSTNLMAIIFIIFSASMAVGTILEKIYTTDTAKSFIYEAHWFEILMLILIVSIIGNIINFRLFKKEKFPLLIFHISFILLFIGGTISRYIGFEGMMLIKEGFTSHNIISYNTFIFLKVFEGKKINFYKSSYLFSPLHSNFQGRFKFKDDLIKVKIIDYVPYAKSTFIENSNGKPFIKVVTIALKGNIINYIKQGEFKKKNMIAFGNKYTSNICNIFNKNGLFYILPKKKGKYIILSTGKYGALYKGIPCKLNIRTLYKIGSIKLVIPEPVHLGILKSFSCYKKEKDNLINTISAQITVNKFAKIISFLGRKDKINNYFILLGSKIITFTYGPGIIKIPFFLHLNKINIKYYPGSYLPSSFSSELTVVDKNREKKISVFMNNVFDYKGYRFFQSGYEPHGSHLLVNHDYCGRIISYTGYFLLGIGMFLTLFWKETRFYKIRRTIFEISKICFSIFPIFLFIGINAKQRYIYSFEKRININEVINASPEIPQSHVKKFSNLLVQNEDGRIEPIHTMAVKLLRKIHNNENIGSWSPSRWMLDIYLKPTLWLHVPFIKVSSSKESKNKLKVIYANAEGYTSLLDFYRFNPQTGEISFLLQKDYEEALSKKPSRRKKYDKEIINLNERIGVMSGILKGQYLRIFPVIHDINNTWISWMQKDMFKIDTIAFSLLNNYFVSLSQAQINSNWKKADEYLTKIKYYQYYYGYNIIPSKIKIKTEIFFNLFRILNKIIYFYLILGIILLLLAFINFFRTYKVIYFFSKIFTVFIFCNFLVQTANLALRWYISGYSPGSNGYESSLFISWCIILVGLFFFTGKNFFIPSISSLASASLLIIANGNIMNQDIINLVPVLKSYWLMIHVVVIASSYGFFSLGCLLGLIVLILYIFYPVKGIKFSLYRKIKIQELTLINELSITVGLFFITIGTFLGGIWANESWGRYWSWDPKETWALISIIIYSFILHMRLVSWLNGEFSFNFASIISLSSILMTYFGVNYYLSGLHSYAKDDPIPIHRGIYYVIISIISMSVLSKFLYNRYYDFSSSIFYGI